MTDKTKSREESVAIQFAEMMVEKLESINSNWKKPWFCETSLAWPRNMNFREYNGGNALMLMMQCEKKCYKLPIFCTFDRMIGLNYTTDKQGAKQPITDADGVKLPHVGVNKGERGFPVYITTYTCVNAETKERIKYDDFIKMSEEDRSKFNTYPKLQVYSVFNIDQTNMKEARPELYKKLEEQVLGTIPSTPKEDMFAFPVVDHMIEHNEWICPIKPTHGDDAYYSISQKEIVVPEKEQFNDGESFYSNLFHEMSHSTGAEEYLNRLKPTSFGSKEYAREELVAELTAALVSQRYGMSKTVKEDSLPYLKSWLERLKEEPQFIKTVLTDVMKSSRIITRKIDELTEQAKN